MLSRPLRSPSFARTVALDVDRRARARMRPDTAPGGRKPGSPVVAVIMVRSEFLRRSLSENGTKT